MRGLERGCEICEAVGLLLIWGDELLAEEGKCFVIFFSSSLLSFLGVFVLAVYESF